MFLFLIFSQITRKWSQSSTLMPGTGSSTCLSWGSLFVIQFFWMWGGFIRSTGDLCHLIYLIDKNITHVTVYNACSLSKSMFYRYLVLTYPMKTFAETGAKAVPTDLPMSCKKYKKIEEITCEYNFLALYKTFLNWKIYNTDCFRPYLRTASYLLGGMLVYNTNVWHKIQMFCIFLYY